MIPFFGMSFSQATVNQGEKRRKKEFDPAFFLVELRAYFE